VALTTQPRGGVARLLSLEEALVERAEDLAVFLVYDRPQRERERPGLARTYFAERCVSDEQLELMIDAFREVNAYVELFPGEQAFIEALADGRLRGLPQALKVAYNGIGWGIASDGFKAGRKSLIPLLADSYGLTCANSDAYACAFTLHKFHSFVVLDAIGVPIPKTWHYRPPAGWIGKRPPDGAKVIAKSTYEAWSVGVTQDSIFTVDEASERRLESLAADIGQALTVQEFIPGTEVCVPVISCPQRLVAPPMEAVITRAPDDPDAVMTIDDNLTSGGVSHRPFRGPERLLRRLEKQALEVFDALELQGLTRIDFRIDDQERPWVFDVAISPGVGRKSSAFLSLAELGLDHPRFMRAVVAASLGSEGLLGA